MKIFLSLLSWISLIFGVWCLICTLSNLLFFRRHRSKATKINIDGKRKVSVIIPARNEEEHLPRLLDSLLNQDYPNYEVM